MTVKVGDTAPDFTLRDQNGQDVTLSAFRGSKSVLIVFYPFAFSGICTGELCEVRGDLASFQNDHVQVLGVSCDTVFSLKKWAQQESYEFPLLSDYWPHGRVAEAYGVFDDSRGMAIRGTYLVDVEGTVRFEEVNGPGQARDQSVWKRALDELAAV